MFVNKLSPCWRWMQLGPGVYFFGACVCVMWAFMCVIVCACMLVCVHVCVCSKDKNGFFTVFYMHGCVVGCTNVYNMWRMNGLRKCWNECSMSCLDVKAGLMFCVRVVALVAVLWCYWVGDFDSELGCPFPSLNYLLALQQVWKQTLLPLLRCCVMWCAYWQWQALLQWFWVRLLHGKRGSPITAFQRVWEWSAMGAGGNANMQECTNPTMVRAGPWLFFSTCLCCHLRTLPLWLQASVFVRAGLCFCELPSYVQWSDYSVLWWHCCEAVKDWKEGDPCLVVWWQKKNAARSCESTLRLGIQQMMWRMHQGIRWQSDVKNTKDSTCQMTWKIFVKPTKDTLPDVGAAGNL